MERILYKKWGWSCSILAILASGFMLSSNSFAQEFADHPTLADVVIDGRKLFQVRGVSSYPAERRAATVKAQIIEVADDASIAIDQIIIVDAEDATTIMGGHIRIMRIFDADAEVEAVPRDLLAETNVERIREVVERYRLERTSDELLQRVGYSLIVTVVAVLFAAGFLWVTKRLRTWAERRVRQGLDELERSAHRIISASRVWSVLVHISRALDWGVLLILAYFYLNSVLGLFPWTRPAAIQLFNLVLDPVAIMWQGLLNQIPNIAFLIILYFVVRYVLSLVQIFFRSIHHGRIKFEDFDVEWAMPTYKIVRVVIILFALVIAYPYIPGSGSLAFQGLSVFMGVILSLGASSFISSMIAGLVMTYRGAFKVGDLILVNGQVGRVKDIRVMTTRLQTAKNELITISNSNILNVDVTNYTILAKEKQLILHTEVGIGYDTPWRQVEALLIEAARRTHSLIEEPAPFVLQKSLGDYAVTYELNAYCDTDKILPIYSALHANIQDVFNEHEVQIMSPIYVADPETAKIVPKDKWYTEPAQPPDQSEAGSTP